MTRNRGSDETTSREHLGEERETLGTNDVCRAWEGDEEGGHDVRRISELVAQRKENHTTSAYLCGQNFWKTSHILTNLILIKPSQTSQMGKLRHIVEMNSPTSHSCQVEELASNESSLALEPSSSERRVW